jgi:glycerol-3-phosphate dehydrogenase
MITDHSRIGPERRAADLSRMASEEFDLVVVGGGVTGAGAALDATLRGLSVALVEQRDFGSGTSSRSSKLFHGGLRYLEQLDFRLVREALRERNLMLGLLCPHLARPVSFLYPLTHPVWERAYVGAGIALYDGLATLGKSHLPHHRHLSKTKALELMPALDPGGLVGGIQYWDVQVDDARHTMTIARTAALYGAALASSTRAIGFERPNDRIAGVRVLDLESGSEIVVRSRHVINATGVWTDRVERLAGETKVGVRASKGIHILVPRERIPSTTGVITKTATSVLFVIPWDRHWIIGTTDTDWDLDLAHPAASRTDIEYLLGNVNRILAQPLEPDDIVGVFAGLRPLLQGESDATSKLSREHAVSTVAPGLVTVAGGKYTTYRVMAEDAVDEVAAHLGRDVPGSITATTPLVGAAGYEAMRRRTTALASELRLDVSRLDRLLRRYGDRILDLVDEIRLTPALGEPLPGAPHYLAAEIRYAASHEGALHLDDVLTRRTRISIETTDRGVETARAAASLMGEVLGWSDATVELEVGHYLARVEAERDSQMQPDDRTADAARLGARDVRGAAG